MYEGGVSSILLSSMPGERAGVKAKGRKSPQNPEARGCLNPRRW